jgi:serine/threonine-protein kinase
MKTFDPAIWSRLEPLFDELLDLEPPARADRLATLADQEPDIHAELLLLLAGAESEAPFARSADELGAVLFSTDEAPSRLGGRVGAFEITGELGRGGMGTVYAAERVEGGFEQHVAIKVVKGGFDSEEVLRRFLAERRILARLAHPHIARLIDGGVTIDGLPWFAMERVDGVPLTVFAARERLATPRRLELFLDVCAAVAFAHRNLVVHRDLKPSNVLAQGAGEVKLLDFGIAKLVGGDIQEGLTQTTLRPMTPDHAAPEQEEGGAITTLTDVWQLGRLLEELIAPDFGANLAGNLGRDPGRDLERIVAKARHVEPERRYSSVEALAEDVRRFLDGRAVEARGDSAAYRLSRFVRRHRLGVAAATLILLTVLAGLSVSLWQASVARREANRARQARDLLAELFSGADPRRAEGREVTVREVLDQGLERIAASRDVDPEVQAELLRTIGETHFQLGNMESAIVAYERARKLHQSLGPRFAGAAVEDLVEIGNAHFEGSAWVPARRAYEEALAWLKAQPASRRDEHFHADLLNNLAGVHRALGEFEPAFEVRRAALAIYRRLDGDTAQTTIATTSDLAQIEWEAGRVRDAAEHQRYVVEHSPPATGDAVRNVLVRRSNLGVYLTRLGAFREAEEILRATRERMRQVLGADHLVTLRTARAVGALLVAAGRFAEARAELEPTLELLRAKHGADSPDTAVAATVLATAAREDGDLRRSEELLRQAIPVLEASFGAEHWRVLAAKVQLGRTLLAGGRPKEAAAPLEAALTARRAAGLPGHPDLAVAILAVARLRLAEGRPDEARALAEEARGITAAALGGQHPEVAEAQAVAERAATAR